MDARSWSFSQFAAVCRCHHFLISFTRCARIAQKSIFCKEFNNYSCDNISKRLLSFFPLRHAKWYEACMHYKTKKAKIKNRRHRSWHDVTSRRLSCLLQKKIQMKTMHKKTRRKKTFTHHFEAVAKLFGGLKRIVVCVRCCVVSSRMTTASNQLLHSTTCLLLSWYYYLFIYLAADIRVDLDVPSKCVHFAKRNGKSSIKPASIKWYVKSVRETRQWSEADTKKNPPKTAGLKSNYKCITFFVHCLRSSSSVWLCMNVCRDVRRITRMSTLLSPWFVFRGSFSYINTHTRRRAMHFLAFDQSVTLDISREYTSIERGKNNKK